ncbi:MAG: transporter [Acidobacteriaceae bacterium]|nr:transporter [Acidobacteriaceae bacterium]
MPFVARLRVAALLSGLYLGSPIGSSQTLVPRAYVITPNDANAIVVTYGYNTGNFSFDSSIPVTDAGAQVSIPVLSYYHSFGLFGRSANVTASLPYGVGTYAGTVIGVHHSIYRSGLVDSQYRFSVNLKGGPAMPVEDFKRWQQKMLLGVSLTVVAPTGQYDPRRLVNPGSNRWAFKPELGWSWRRGRWILDAYGGAWLFTGNDRYFPGYSLQTEQAIGSLETHLSRNIRPRFWFSIDGNVWFGGITTLNGVVNVRTRQTSSRVGVTASVPVSRHQSLKVSYSLADYALFGGDFNNVTVAWQYSWIGKPWGTGSQRSSP